MASGERLDGEVARVTERPRGLGAAAAVELGRLGGRVEARRNLAAVIPSDGGLSAP